MGAAHLNSNFFFLLFQENENVCIFFICANLFLRQSNFAVPIYIYHFYLAQLSIVSCFDGKLSFN